MPIALYNAISPPPTAVRYQIGYDTQTGAIHVLDNVDNLVAYLEPRESREVATNILACSSKQRSDGA